MKDLVTVCENCHAKIHALCKAGISIAKATTEFLDEARIKPPPVEKKMKEPRKKKPLGPPGHAERVWERDNDPTWMARARHKTLSKTVKAEMARRVNGL